MRKTVLAISIMTAIFSVNALAISNEDLLDFDNILNAKETTKEKSKEPVATKKEVKKEETKTIKKETLVKEEVKVKEEIIQEDKTIVQKEFKPTIIVPVSGQTITLKIDLNKDKLVRENIAKTEVVISQLNEIEEKYKNEKEILEFTDTILPFSNYTMYETEKDTLTGIESRLDNGILIKKEILTDIKKGFSYFIKIIEIDKRNNRAKLRLDINIIDVNSYDELSVSLADGTHQKIRLPNLKETNNSNEFWINLDSSKQVEYKIDDIYKLKVAVQRDIPFVQQIFVTDHDKIAQIKKDEELKEIKEKEDLKQEKIDEENKLFESLEESLK